MLGSTSFSGTFPWGRGAQARSGVRGRVSEHSPSMIITGRNKVKTGVILGDPGVVSEGGEKSKQASKMFGTRDFS